MSEWIRRIVAALRDIPRELREGSRANARLAEFVEYHRTLNEECKDPNWVPPGTKPKSKMRPLPADHPLRKGIFVMHGFKLLRDVGKVPGKGAKPIEPNA